MKQTIATMFVALALVALAACDRDGDEHNPKALEGSGNISVHSAFGPANVNISNNVCSGRAHLAQGSATVNDNCFTGETNVVVCTDATSPNPVKCAPGKGALQIEGTGSDTVSYARVR